MSLKNTLTNEKLGDRFDNPFALVNYAIKIARVQVEKGQGIEDNVANEVLEMIASGNDHIAYEEQEEEEEEQLEAV